MSELHVRARAVRPGLMRAGVESLAPLALGIAAAWILQYWISPRMNAFHVKVLTDIGIYIILAVSLNIVNGFTGQFSIGHAGFMAIGGYTTAALVYYSSYRWWESADVHAGFAGQALFIGSCVVGGLTAAMAGYLVGLPSLRLRGDYLAIVTLGFGEIVRVLLQRSGDALYDADDIKATPFFGFGQLFDWSQVKEFFGSGFDTSQTTWEMPLIARLGGALGFTGLPRYTDLLWVFSFVAVTLIAAYRLKQSSYGRSFLAIRENEIAAEAMGVPVTRFKVRAFVMSAFFAGIAGGLFAHEVGNSLNAGELGFQKSFDIVIMVVLGGMGSISGAVVAAMVLTIMPEALRAFSEYRMVVYALVLIITMILRPQGLFGVREIWDFRPLKRGTRT